MGQGSLVMYLPTMSLVSSNGCPPKSEVQLVGFWARVYSDNLAVSNGSERIPPSLTARLSLEAWPKSLPRAPHHAFAGSLPLWAAI